MAMTAKQKRFCDEYLVDLNATQAAIRAGYSKRTANEQGARLLANVSVQEYIESRKRDREKRIEVTQDRVIEELSYIAFAKASDYARVVEKDAMVEVEGTMIPALDDEGNPVKYRTVEPILTDKLTEEQKRAIAVIKKGRDGFEIKPYDKIKALELLGKHLGMWSSGADNEEQQARIEKLKAETSQIKGEDIDSGQDDGFIEALKGEVADTWEDE